MIIKKIINYFFGKYCYLHNQECILGIRKIRYGLIYLNDSEKILLKKYPFSKTYRLGGCRVGTTNEESCYYCVKCRKLYLLECDKI